MLHVQTIIEAFANNDYSSAKAPNDNHSYYTNFVRFLFATGCRPEDARARTISLSNFPRCMGLNLSSWPSIVNLMAMEPLLSMGLIFGPLFFWPFFGLLFCSFDCILLNSY